MKKNTKSKDYPLSARIKYLRELRALTQSELASRAGLSQGSLAQFESGRTSPSVQTLYTLAKALDITPAIFFNSDDVLVFDLKKIKDKYKTLDAMPDRLYRDLTRVYFLAKKLGMD